MKYSSNYILGVYKAANQSVVKNINMFFYGHVNMQPFYGPFVNLGIGIGIWIGTKIGTDIANAIISSSIRPMDTKFSRVVT